MQIFSNYFIIKAIFYYNFNIYTANIAFKHKVIKKVSGFRGQVSGGWGQVSGGKE